MERINPRGTEFTDSPLSMKMQVSECATNFGDDAGQLCVATTKQPRVERKVP